MKEKEFWEQKIIQILHDPPAKPYFLRPYSGGHKQLTLRLLDIVLPHEGPRSLRTIPDLLATGADRPLLTLPFREGYGLGNQYFHKDPLVTHPLCRSRLQLPHPGGAPEIAGKDIDDLARRQKEAARLLAEVEAAAGDTKPEELKKIYFAFWRKYRDELVRQEGNDLIWQLMPADSRSPDHSIWDHNRMASALAFVRKRMEPGREQAPDHPWLFSFSLRPVQEFLMEARKSQDLWTGSMLLAELTMAAMEPIIGRYGPDVIVYPDLRGNPRADIWLHGHDPSLLPDGKAPATRAAVIPHTFVAILPRGKAGQDFFAPLEQLGRETCEAVRAAWKELAGEVRSWMEKISGPEVRGSGWDRLWRHAASTCPLESTWAAMPWPVLEQQSQYYWSGGALPFQEIEQSPLPGDREILERRRRLLGQWMDSATWTAYEYTMSVFARTNENLLLHSGFCYAPAHHKLKAGHGMRRRIMTLPEATPADLSFEKCSLCHTRAALGNSDFGQGTGDCESIREQVRKLWQERELDPEETGSERLCAVCATKRFLVRADSEKDDTQQPNRFNRVWAGPGKTLGEIRKQLDFSDSRIRTPFPSTVQIAAQQFLCDVAAGFSSLKEEAEVIIMSHERLEIQRSAFPDSLPALGRAVQEYPAARKFLMLDPQLAFFPEMVESAASYAGKNQGKNQGKNKDKNEERWNNLARAVRGFREQARKLGLGDPPTQVAVVCMDGDRMGKLLLHGSPEEPPVCWKHILHPDVVRKIRSKKRFIESGWGDLLRLPRLAGPALHAFISRALADFSHTIVPWVVEQEFAGRLIYSGGDDLLALAPADQALAMANRLRTLYASPWIMDTRPKIRPWSWLEQGSFSGGPERAEDRFRIIDDNKDLQEYLSGHGSNPPGRIMPMLGPGCTMSAGIMYGHFKTPLGRLLENSHTLLDTWAKGRAGRNSVGLGHFSRGGVKTMFAAPWDTGSQGLSRTVEMVRDSFADPRKGLPSSLPYKLREQRLLLDPFDLEENAGMGEEKTTRLMQGLLARAVGEEGVDDATRKAVLALWQAGRRLARSAADSGDGRRREVDDLAGLFFCRYLGARTGGN